ncbi:MAG: deoxyribonuclease IV [Parachlamydiales bacterium]|nr:deoxyribonuclease IV [Parachlamydiales bacterium]
MKTPQELLIGAHMSAAGGVSNALKEGFAIGATTIQLFTNNQKQWFSKPIADEEVERWHQLLEETQIKEVMSHDSYLINLGCPNPENLEKSRKAFSEELQRCHALKISYLNFHPGAALKEPKEKCLDLIVQSLLDIEKLTQQGSTTLLLEATAGQGSVVGCTFEELGYIISKTHKHIPIGVCIDTCHIFAAGYDIRTKESLDKTLKDFDEKVGLKYLRAFHMNDSMKGLGTRVDRHSPLGQGEIGIEAFKLLMQDKRTRDLPKYLETPDGPPLWKEEIRMLREFAEGN